MLSVGLVALLLRACAPNVDPQTQASLLTVESGGEPYAISDSNTGRSYYPRSYLEAVTLTERLIRDDARRFGPGDLGLGIGVVQIQTTNFARLGLTPSIALDPCLNLRVGSEMLAAAYREQYRAIGGAPSPRHRARALDRALQVYNSGRPYGVDAYVARVLLASRGAFVRSIIAPIEPPAALRPPIAAAAPIATAAARKPTKRTASRSASLRAPAARPQRSSDFYVDTASPQFQFTHSVPAAAASATSFR